MHRSTPPHKISSKVEHIKHLMAQREHLLVLRDHMEWLSKTNDSEALLPYQNIADLLEHAVNEYDVLMTMLLKEINQHGKMDGA